jgi:hypothetical protein
VALQLRVAIKQGTDRIMIQLKPAALGIIDMKLDIGADGRVTATISVERPETLEMLQRDARGLERALQDAGLRTDSGSLSFNLRGDGRHGFGQAGNASDPDAVSTMGEADDAVDVGPIGRRPPIDSSRALDIQV